MTAPLALLMAISGGFFGTMVALTGFYLVVRVIVDRAFQQWLKGPHERDECPVCKRTMQHEKETDE